MTDTKTKAKPAKLQFADELQQLLFIYNTMPDPDRFAVDKALTQYLDISPKDWVMAMNALTTALHVKQ
jgi:hypothetical protein